MMRRSGFFTHTPRQGLAGKGKTGFTLVELLIVIAIIGILVTLGIYASSSMNIRGRNSTRKADLERIKNVLEQYNSDHRSYPAFDVRPAPANQVFAAEWQLTTDTAVSCAHHGTTTARLTTKYIDTIPGDPKNKFTACPIRRDDDQSGLYLYLSSSTATALDSFPNAFTLMATLEDPTAASDKINPANSPFAASGPARFDYFRDFAVNGINANYIVTGGR